MEKLLKNENIANFDEYQMHQMAYDSKKQAFRFTCVDGISLNADNIKLPSIEIPKQSPIVIKEIEYKEIKVPEIIKETIIQTIEVPVITTEIRYVEKPILIPEIKVIEIEKPIIIKEIEYRVIEQKIFEMPLIAKVCMVIQALTLIGILLTKTL